MADLNTDVRYIKGIGEQRAKALGKLGIATLRDLISYFPRAYDDRSALRRIADLVPGETAGVAAMVASPPTISHIRKGLDLVKLRAVDDTGTLDVTFFNQAWLKNSLHQGETYIFYGRAEGSLLRHQMANPVVEPEGRREVTGRIVPIYPLTAGVSQLILSRSIRQGLDACADILPDVLPDRVRRHHQLCRIEYAYENIHFPESAEALDLARRRLAFEELFLFTIGLERLRSRWEVVHVPPCGGVDMELFYRALPFTLTDAQRRCVEEALADMRSGTPMNRLCQGDVGSGKTILAFLAMAWCAQNGYQSAIMAPTEVLAQQHYETFQKLCEQFGLHFPVILLTGSMTAKQKRSAYERLELYENALIVGTHALIQEKPTYANLALVITDEQHRFGVRQREEFAQKGDMPHILVMSATPIPRTLAIIIYGDMDISVVDEVPARRLPIKNCVVNTAYRPKAYAFVADEVKKGHQAYVICPLVEASEEAQGENVIDYSKTLMEELPSGIQVGVLHGKMKSSKKNEIMQEFAENKIQVLVSTTVVEVGVNVPNATVMLIENADRFGLAQLHQLRGRVGRGDAQSYCIMINASSAKTAEKRLEILNKSNDGFFIASEDLKLRGPGDFFGIRQSGDLVFALADIYQDAAVLQEASEEVKTILEEDPELTEPGHHILQKKMMQFQEEQLSKMNL